MEETHCSSCSSTAGDSLTSILTSATFWASSQDETEGDARLVWSWCGPEEGSQNVQDSSLPHSAAVVWHLTSLGLEWLWLYGNYWCIKLSWPCLSLRLVAGKIIWVQKLLWDQYASFLSEAVLVECTWTKAMALASASWCWGTHILVTDHKSHSVALISRSYSRESFWCARISFLPFPSPFFSVQCS